jgi:Flp pilus assembly secretin CpaC
MPASYDGATVMPTQGEGYIELELVGNGTLTLGDGASLVVGGGLEDRTITVRVYDGS